MHEVGQLADGLSLSWEAAQPLVRGLDQFVVLQPAVSPLVEHLEHQPHALRAELLAGDDLRGPRKVRLLSTRDGTCFEMDREV